MGPRASLATRLGLTEPHLQRKQAVPLTFPPSPTGRRRLRRALSPEALPTAHRLLLHTGAPEKAAGRTPWVQTPFDVCVRGTNRRAPGGSALVPGSRQEAGGQRPPGPGPTRPPENRPTGGPSRGLPGQTRRLTHHPGPPLDKAATNLKAKKKKKEKEKMHGEKDRKHRPVQGQRKEQHLLFKIYRKSEHVSTWRYS